MPISLEKIQDLKKKMKELGIEEKDIDEKFILGSGKGGQKINKTSSCVSVHHLPSGIKIKCQKTRSRADNRFFAKRELCDQYEILFLNKKSSKEIEEEKLRKQKKRRKRRQKPE
jgi:protein subunit release factor B